MDCYSALGVFSIALLGGVTAVLCRPWIEKSKLNIEKLITEKSKRTNRTSPSRRTEKSEHTNKMENSATPGMDRVKLKKSGMDKVKVEQWGDFGDPSIVNLGYNSTLLSMLRDLFRDDKLVLAAKMMLPDNTPAPLDSRVHTLEKYGRCELLVNGRKWGHLTFL